MLSSTFRSINFPCTSVHVRTCTIDWEIFITKKFWQSPSTPKIKQVKYFFGRINVVSLFHQVVIVTNIKPGKSLTGGTFHLPKISRLRYVCVLVLMDLNMLRSQSELSTSLKIHLDLIFLSSVWLDTYCL